ncbi:MAG: CHAT domain-containing protein [Balneolaceae bacterium]|jgi:CHAT domain-containing protein/Tfp pilus assembly protein PilF
MKKKRLLLCWGMLFFLPICGLGQSQQLADSLFRRGKSFDDSGHNKQAEFYYGEAYRLYRQVRDTAGWLKAGKEYASALMYSSKNPQAMKLYKMLLMVKHPANDAYNRGDILNSMGLSSNRMGKPDLALKYYQKSLPLAEESGDSLLIGVVYDNMGGVYYSKGDLGKSLEFRKKAFPYFKGLRNQRSMAITLGNIGSIYEKFSLYDKALENYTKSLKIREKLGDVNLLSGIYDSIAGVQLELGNYDQALVAYNKSLDYSRQSGIPQRTAATLNNIGLLYKELGEYDKALDYYRQSLDLSEGLGNSPQSIATTTRNIGKLLWAQGKYKQAAPLYRKALELREKVGNPYDIASSLSSMAQLEYKAGHFERALQYADTLQAIGDSTGSHLVLRNASTWKGVVEDSLGNHRAALSHFKKSFAHSEHLAPEDRLDPLKRLAAEFHKMDSDSAIYYGQKAIDIIERNRSNAGTLSELKSGYFQRHSDFYTKVASWVLKYEQNTSRAYRLVEQAKARSFTDELEKAAKNIEQQLPEEVRIMRNKKNNHINDLYAQLERTQNSEKKSAIEQKIRSAELDYAAYESSLHEKYPALKSLKSPEPVSLEQAQEMTDEKTAVLEYAMAGNELIMFLISQDKVRVEQFSLSGNRRLDTQLTSWVADYKDAILAEAAQRELQSASAKLYKVLVKPFEEDLDNYTNLIIVPDGALAYLPFEAILNNGQYLIERYRIKYEPSLTSLKMLKEQNIKHPKDLLAVAGSNVAKENIGGSFKSVMAALPSTLIEVDSIASHFKKVSVLEKDNVSEGAFKRMVRDTSYRYVHLATHGIIDESDPRRSGLALSAEGMVTASSKEDGLLRSSEIFGLNINSEMVVLSACNTGLGKVVKGEGMLGMQRSFFYAGTSTVVVSLWNVYDRSTAFMMNEFYKELLKDQQSEADWADSLLRRVGWDTSIPFGRKAEAMRQAKLKMIHHPLFNHPIYWAPFIVVGR